MHVTTQECPNIISGIWKFQKVEVDTLAQLAESWLTKEPLSYSRLYIRRCSKDQYGIGFEYLLTEGANLEKSHKKFFHRITDQLKRKFGNKFVGWDISRPTWIVQVSL